MVPTSFIPFLNEVGTIEKAIQGAVYALRSNLKDKHEIIVADNGSTDGTLEIINKIRNIRTIHVPVKGYGAALHYGILSAKFPFVLFADADLSYSFWEIKKFIPYLDKNIDLVLGSRFKGKIDKYAMPFLHRYLGTPILTLLIRTIYGIRTTDCNSGMRMIRKSFYKELIMRNSGMEWASELLIKSVIHRGKYAEVPISFQKDKRKNKPHLRRWEDGWRHLKVIILFKPSILFFSAIAMIVAGIIFIPFSLFTTIAFFLIAEFIFMSYLAVRKLEAYIDKEPNFVSKILEKIPLVLIATLVSIFGFFQLLIISDQHLFTKYIFLSQPIMFDLFVFFIETIKTYLVNPLPEKI